MKKTWMRITLLTGLGLVLTIMSAWGAVPPPPVNQTIGFRDAVTDFSGRTATVNRAFCAQCHPGSLVERHHNLILTKNLDCLACHTLAPGRGGFQFTDFRECTSCHKNSPHHTSAAAQARNCRACHGTLVDNFDDGHRIPTYPISSVTPRPGGVQLQPNRFAGGCKACHRGDTALGLAENNMTHHGIGIGIPEAQGGSGGDCLWCHGGSPADPHTYSNIRKCQECHGIRSLHNIQPDTPAPANLGTIVPGAESMGYGHIGHNRDCIGCHVASVLPYSSQFDGPLSPSITDLSVTSLPAGRAATLKVTGDALFNSSATSSYPPALELVKGEQMIKLYPTSYSATEMVVDIPPILAAGNYELRVVKNDTFSNKRAFVVTQPLTLTGATLANGVVTIRGSGFGATAGRVFFGNVAGTVTGWSDTRISVVRNGLARGNPTVVTAAGATGSVMVANRRQ